MARDRNIRLIVTIEVERCLVRSDRDAGEAADDLNVINVDAGRGDRAVRSHSPTERYGVSIRICRKVDNGVNVSADRCSRPCLTSGDRTANEVLIVALYPPLTNEPPAVMMS